MNKEGKMDGWLGKVVTIESTFEKSNAYFVEENGWVWFESAIAGLAEERDSIPIKTNSTFKTDTDSGSEIIASIRMGIPPEPVGFLKERLAEQEMKVMLDEGAILPTRAHPTDAGLDLYAPRNFKVPSSGSAIIDIGVHVELPEGTAGFLKSKSGLNVKHDITSEGVIDEGYTGAIVVKLYNHGSTDYYIRRGDKISQLVILPVVKPQLIVVEKLTNTERGDNGFGSTGR